MKPSIFILGKTIVSVVVMAFLARHIDLVTVTQILRQISLARLTLISVGLTFSSLIPAIRWVLVLRHLGISLGIGPALRLSLIGSFFNQVLPSGVGGDVIRAWYTRQHGIGGGKSVESVLGDRILGLSALVLQAVIGIPCLGLLNMEPTLRWRLATAAAALTFGLLSFLFLDHLFPNRLLRLLPKESGAVASLERGIAYLAHVSVATRQLMFSFPSICWLLALSLANQLSVAAALHLVFLGCGVDLPLSNTLMLFPFVALMGMIPISLAGWGVREGAMVLIFSTVHVPREASLGVSVLFGIAMLASSLLGGILWLARLRRNNMGGAAR